MLSIWKKHNYFDLESIVDEILITHNMTRQTVYYIYLLNDKFEVPNTITQKMVAKVAFKNSANIKYVA